MLAGRRQEEQQEGGEELEDRAHYVLAVDGGGDEVGEDELQDREEGGGQGEAEPRHDPGGPGNLPGLAGQAVVDIEGEGGEQHQHREEDQHRVLETFCQPGGLCVPGELAVPELCPAELHRPPAVHITD